VLFLCRNNGYAISLPTERQTAVRTLSDKATAYAIPALRVDGNDVLAVWRAVREGVRRAVEGGGPTFVELLTYRLGGHSTSDDPRAYRTEQEVQSRRKTDPLPRLREHIEQQEAWSDDFDADWRAACEAEVRQCVRRAEQRPAAALGDIFTQVYAEQPWHLREQQEQCLAGRKTDDEDGEP
jgi:2-oxoisovalerate dehydrogenase E1 component alpha subunit